MDAVMLLVKGEDRLLGKLKIHFRICQEIGLYLSAKKIVLFVTHEKWCGIFISKEGIRL